MVTAVMVMWKSISASQDEKGSILEDHVGCFVSFSFPAYRPADGYPTLQRLSPAEFPGRRFGKKEELGLVSELGSAPDAYTCK